MADQMISLKRYLDLDPAEKHNTQENHFSAECEVFLSLFGSSLAEFATSGAKACPVLAAELQKGITRLRESLSVCRGIEDMRSVESSARTVVRDWGDKTAAHYEQKAGEIKDLLMIVARATESLGSKDDRYTQQLAALTSQLQSIASLEDLNRIRASLEESARELKTSVARIVAESRAVIDHLRVEVSAYERKLEQAEYIASRDPLTGVGSRTWMEDCIREKIEAPSQFSVVLIDIQKFNRINAEYGELVGDILLKEFAKELRSSCRFSDLVGRWGADEFVVLMECVGPEAHGQIARLQSWICGPYAVRSRCGHVHVRLEVSIGLAEFQSGDDLNSLLDRADADLCAFRDTARDRRLA